MIDVFDGRRVKALVGGESEQDAGGMLSTYQLKRRVDGLDTRVDLVEKNISTLASNINASVSSIVDINNKQQDQIASAIAINNEQAIAISKVIGDVSAVSGVSSGSVKSLGELSSSVANLQKVISAHESKIGTFTATEYNTYKKNVTDAFNVVDANLQTVYGSVSSLVTQNSKQQTQIDALNAYTNQLAQDIGKVSSQSTGFDKTTWNTLAKLHKDLNDGFYKQGIKIGVGNLSTI